VERDWHALLWFVLAMWFVVRPLGGYLARERDQTDERATRPSRKPWVTFTPRRPS